jgi:hypothetical protein
MAILAPAPGKVAAYLYPGDNRHTASTAWGAAALLGLALPFLIAPALCPDPPDPDAVAAADAADAAAGRLPPPAALAVGPLLLVCALGSTVVTALTTALRWVATSARGRGPAAESDVAAAAAAEERFYRHRAADAAADRAAAGGEAGFLGAVWDLALRWRVAASVAAAGALLGVGLAELQVLGEEREKETRDGDAGDGGGRKSAFGIRSAAVRGVHARTRSFKKNKVRFLGVASTLAPANSHSLLQTHACTQCTRAQHNHTRMPRPVCAAAWVPCLPPCPQR